MKIAERASQIWAVLAWAASHRQNITYAQLAQATGAFTGGLGALLEPIQSYCLLKGIPCRYCFDSPVKKKNLTTSIGQHPTRNHPLTNLIWLDR